MDVCEFRFSARFTMTLEYVHKSLLKKAKERDQQEEEQERGLKVNFICADLDDYELLEDAYDLVINFYYLNLMRTSKAYPHNKNSPLSIT